MRLSMLLEIDIILNFLWWYSSPQDFLAGCSSPDSSTLHSQIEIRICLAWSEVSAEYSLSFTAHYCWDNKIGCYWQFKFVWNYRHSWQLIWQFQLGSLDCGRLWGVWHFFPVSKLCITFLHESSAYQLIDQLISGLSSKYHLRSIILLYKASCSLNIAIRRGVKLDPYQD